MIRREYSHYENESPTRDFFAPEHICNPEFDGPARNLPASAGACSALPVARRAAAPQELYGCSDLTKQSRSAWLREQFKMNGLRGKTCSAATGTARRKEDSITARLFKGRKTKPPAKTAEQVHGKRQSLLPEKNLLSTQHTETA